MTSLDRIVNAKESGLNQDHVIPNAALNGINVLRAPIASTMKILRYKMRF